MESNWSPAIARLGKWSNFWIFPESRNVQSCWCSVDSCFIFFTGSLHDSPAWAQCFALPKVSFVCSVCCAIAGLFVPFTDVSKRFRNNYSSRSAEPITSIFLVKRLLLPSNFLITFYSEYTGDIFSGVLQVLFRYLQTYSSLSTDSSSSNLLTN